MRGEEDGVNRETVGWEGNLELDGKLLKLAQCDYIYYCKCLLP